MLYVHRQRFSGITMDQGQPGDPASERETVTAERRRAGRLNLNRCTADELSRGSGLGAEKAGRIVAYRRRKQRFCRLSDALNVRGVTEKDLRILRQTCCQVRPPPDASTTAATARPGRVNARQRPGRRRAASTATPTKRRPDARGVLGPCPAAGKPGTSRKGTQTAVTGDTPVKSAAARKARQGGGLLPGRRNSRPDKFASSEGKKRTPTKKKTTMTRKEKRDVERPATGFSSPPVGRNRSRSSSDGSLLMCLEARRLKASEGLDYNGDSCGSPRPQFLAAVSGTGCAGEPGRGSPAMATASARVNGCAVTVRLPARAPLMSPVVTVSIPPSGARGGGGGGGGGLEIVGRNVWRTRRGSREPPPPMPGLTRRAANGPNNTLDQNNSNNMGGEGEVGGAVVEGTSEEAEEEEEEEDSRHQRGYLAGSDTDHTSLGLGDDHRKTVPVSRRHHLTDGNNDVPLPGQRVPGGPGVPAAGEEPAAAAATRKARRSAQRAAEKVQSWLESSAGRRDSETAADLRAEDEPPRSPIGESFVQADLPPLLPPPPPSSSPPLCRWRVDDRGLAEDLDAATAGRVANGPAAMTRRERWVQTPPCTCRSCRRGRRDAARRSGEAEERCQVQPGGVGSAAAAGGGLTPTEEIKPAWCSLL